MYKISPDKKRSASPTSAARMRSFPDCSPSWFVPAVEIWIPADDDEQNCRESDESGEPFVNQPGVTLQKFSTVTTGKDIVATRSNLSRKSNYKSSRPFPSFFSTRFPSCNCPNYPGFHRTEFAKSLRNSTRRRAPPRSSR